MIGGKPRSVRTLPYRAHHTGVVLIRVSPMFPTDRQLFYALCKVHLGARSGGGFITDQASRLLFNHVKKVMDKVPSATLEDVTIEALDRFPYRRIDLDILEKFELVPRNPQYAVSATGDEFKFRSILAEAFIGGEPKVLIDWIPTWEPVANVRKDHLKNYRDKKRNKRRVNRRAKAALARAQGKA